MSRTAVAQLSYQTKAPRIDRLGNEVNPIPAYLKRCRSTYVRWCELANTCYGVQPPLLEIGVLVENIEIPDYLPSWIADHIKLYLEDPESAHMWDSAPAGGPGVLPTLLLISTGRKSGQKRALPLIYRKVGDNFVIVASKGGAPDHPAWYLNLVQSPECEIRVGAQAYRAHARTAEGDERAELWPMLAEVYPPYNDYQKTAGDREIPMVVLEPQA